MSNSKVGDFYKSKLRPNDWKVNGKKSDLSSSERGLGLKRSSLSVDRKTEKGLGMRRNSLNRQKDRKGSVGKGKQRREDCSSSSWRRCANSDLSTFFVRLRWGQGKTRRSWAQHDKENAVWQVSLNKNLLWGDEWNVSPAMSLVQFYSKFLFLHDQ